MSDIDLVRKLAVLPVGWSGKRLWQVSLEWLKESEAPVQSFVVNNYMDGRKKMKFILRGGVYVDGGGGGVYVVGGGGVVVGGVYVVVLGGVGGGGVYVGGVGVGGGGGGVHVLLLVCMLVAVCTLVAVLVMVCVSVRGGGLLSKPLWAWVLGRSWPGRRRPCHRWSPGTFHDRLAAQTTCVVVVVIVVMVMVVIKTLI